MYYLCHLHHETIDQCLPQILLFLVFCSTLSRVFNGPSYFGWSPNSILMESSSTVVVSIISGDGMFFATFWAAKCRPTPLLNTLRNQHDRSRPTIIEWAVSESNCTQIHSLAINFANPQCLVSRKFVAFFKDSSSWMSTICWISLVNNSAAVSLLVLTGLAELTKSNVVLLIYK